jgi:hypothetical protein
MGMFAKARERAAAGVVGELFFNGPRNTQKLGTDLQPGSQRRTLADIEAHTVIFQNEGDHASSAKELFTFSYREDTGLQIRQGIGKVLLVMGGEQNLAGSPPAPADSLDEQFPAFDGFSAYHTVQYGTERIFPEYADSKRRVRTGGGPLDEFGEIQEERRFDLVLLRRLVLG